MLLQMHTDLEEFVVLTTLKRETETKLNTFKDQLAEIEPRLIDALVETGIKQIGKRGMTLSIRRQLWASATDIEACKICEDTKLLVKETINTQTLSSYVRELETDDDNMPILPAILKDAIRVTEKFSIQARKI